jgi:hypothetical protein
LPSNNAVGHFDVMRVDKLLLLNRMLAFGQATTFIHMWKNRVGSALAAVGAGAGVLRLVAVWRSEQRPFGYLVGGVFGVAIGAGILFVIGYSIGSVVDRLKPAQLPAGARFVPMPQAAPPSGPPSDAGWYPDPFGRFQSRHWDGEIWTEHVANDGRGYVDDPSTFV